MDYEKEFYKEKFGQDPNWPETFKNLCQEAIKIGMELNHQYPTPQEIQEIMARLTGKEIDPTFRLFPPFYTDFGKNIRIGKDVFKTKEELPSEMAV